MNHRMIFICSAGLLFVLIVSSLFGHPGTQDRKASIEDLLDRAKQLPIEEQIELVHALREHLSERLLETDPALASGLETLEEETPVRVNRLLNRGALDRPAEIRGGGAYFSFTTLTNDYNREPSIGLEQWRIDSGFYGRNFGYVLPLGTVPIRSIGMDQVPDFLLQEDVQELKQYVRENRQPSQPEARPGLSYIVRWVGFDEGDQLAAIEVLEKDRYGITFAWKILREFEIPR